jgi:hypothetical protein
MGKYNLQKEAGMSYTNRYVWSQHFYRGVQILMWVFCKRPVRDNRFKEGSIIGLTGEAPVKINDVTQSTKLFAHQIIKQIAH